VEFVKYKHENYNYFKNKGIEERRRKRGKKMLNETKTLKKVLIKN